MESLKIDKQINGYRLEWIKEMIVIYATRIVTKSDNISCELAISTTNPSYKHAHLHQKRFNLTSTTSHRTLVKAMDEKYPHARTGVNWDALLEQLSAKILKFEREGEPVVEMWTSDETHKPQYLLKPLLQQGQVTMIFGEGGVGKSYIAALMSMCVSLPWSDNPFELKTNGKPVSTLLCDYETSRNTVAWRLKALQRGLGIPPVNLFYRRCSVPFTEDSESIKQAPDF